MRQIVPSGSYFEIDADGCIVNPCATDLVPAELWPLIQALIASYQDRSDSELLAIYLRGSVPRGQYMPPVSDLDIVGIVAQQVDEDFVTWGTPAWANTELEQIKQQFPDAPRIDLAIAHHDPDFPGQNRYVKFVLKTQALCIWGSDQTQAWPAYPLQDEIAFYHRWLQTDWEIWQQQWRGKEASPEKTAFLQSFTKTILRAGHELVMTREGRYSVDLYPCYEGYARHYTAQSANMRAALQSYLNPQLPDPIHDTWMESLLPKLIHETATRLAQKPAPPTE